MSNWQTAEHALAYLERADRVPQRAVGEALLLDEIPACVARVLDLGCGDGRLLDLVLRARPHARGVALDFSSPMLQRLKQRFPSSALVDVVEHDFAQPLPDLGWFSAIVSSLAIHHVPHGRKRALYQEVWSMLEPGGVFCNLEHVASPTLRVHYRFLEELGITPEQEDPSNKLLDVESQLRWLREIGFEDVDCYWKWRELALLIGRKAVSDPRSTAREAVSQV